MHVEFIMDALEEAIEQYGCPEIMNTDQGSQYTSAHFIQGLKDRAIQVSMDGKGAGVTIFLSNDYGDPSSMKIFFACL
ncbi:MAG: hypothetical protein NPIRA01_16680 [Nitrospirales bacterium]|nr:MAG: hypothetical protein NPIRA01_16680 [Nitrospirales bacterium]